MLPVSSNEVELQKSLQCKLPVSFRPLLEVNEQRRKSSQLKERVKRAIDNYGREDRLIFLRV